MYHTSKYLGSINRLNFEAYVTVRILHFDTQKQKSLIRFKAGSPQSTFKASALKRDIV